MTRGYLTLAQNGKYDYVRMAYILAISLKISQGIDTNLSIIVNKNDIVPEEYCEVFDKIIKVDSPDTEWKVQNKWIYYDVSPYDETIVVDADMLFLTDQSWWWDLFSLNDLSFTDRVLNFRGEEVTSDYYRKVFTENSLPNHYTGLFFFRKCKNVENYFKLVKIIFENWEEWYNYLLKNPPKYVSGDVVYAIASKIMFKNTLEVSSPFLEFVHMRNKLQDAGLSGDWTKNLRCDLTEINGDVSLKINNIIQSDPFHYIEKSFLTDEVVKFYEEKMLCLLR